MYGYNKFFANHQEYSPFTRVSKKKSLGFAKCSEIQTLIYVHFIKPLPTLNLHSCPTSILEINLYNKCIYNLQCRCTDIRVHEFQLFHKRVNALCFFCISLSQSGWNKSMRGHAYIVKSSITYLSYKQTMLGIEWTYVPPCSERDNDERNIRNDEGLRDSSMHAMQARTCPDDTPSINSTSNCTITTNE